MFNILKKIFVFAFFISSVQANETIRPNVLIIVADDLGYSDLSSFGGEVPTPNLDSIANTGMKFTNMQAAPTCSPSRAMLLTGVDHHLAGLGNMMEEMAPNQKGKRGYEGFLNDDVVTIASVLKGAGYRTYYTGKWHLGGDETQVPHARGFDRSFAMLAGGASHYNDMRTAYSPVPGSKAPYSEDGVKLYKLPKDFQYSSQYYAEKIIDYIYPRDNKKNKKPFFAMLNFTAPHWPLQAPKEEVNKFKYKYDIGFEKIYTARFKRQKQLGLIGKGNVPSKVFPKGNNWSSLSTNEKKRSIKRMEIYAAMISQLDFYSGEVINSLKEHGDFDNTLIIFLSDNGAEGHILDEIWSSKSFPKIRKQIDNSHDFSYGNMGEVNSYTLLGPNWARAVSPGFTMFKGYPTLGGTQIISFIKEPNSGLKGGMSNELTMIKDIAPTVLDITGVKHPQTYKGKPVLKMSGTSLYPILKGSSISPRVHISELFGRVSVHENKWQAIKNFVDPNSDWILYDLSNDSTNNNDLSKSHPHKLEKLISEWDKYKAENNVIIPNSHSEY